MIATFARFDIVNFVTPFKKVLPSLLFVVLAAVLSPWPALGIGTAAIVMSLLAANSFASDERGRLDTLYAVLPISRRTVVVGRYLALVVLYLAVALAATLIAVLVPLIQHKSVAAEVLLPVNVAGLLIFVTALAVQLPFFFSVGFTRARPLMYLPMAVLVGVAWLAGQTGMLNDADFTPLLSINPVLLCAIGVGASIVLLVVSGLISSARYARRAL